MELPAVSDQEDVKPAPNGSSNEVIPDPAGQDEGLGRKKLLHMAMIGVKGPLPPPFVMRDYDPEVQACIIQWVASQINHRQSLEKDMAEGNEIRANRGQIISAVLTVFCVSIAAAVTLSEGSTAFAIVLAVIGVGGPSAATMISRVIGRTLEAGSLSDPLRQERPGPEQG